VESLPVVLILVSIIAAKVGDGKIVASIRIHSHRLICTVTGVAVIAGATLLDVDIGKPPGDNALRSDVEIHLTRSGR